jgi:hypothetical protein
MGYLGNEPTSNFASVTKDLFSGDGSTVAFTLSKASTTNGVAVFVENVRQEPTIAYAVSGTTLTFTAAPVSSSGNNIYVLHHNAVASTANHPAAQDLTAVKGTFTGTVDINGQELILDADADTSITADTDDQIDFRIGGSDQHKFGTEVVFNEQGADINFRVEGDGNANLFKIDAGNDRVGIGTDPTNTFSISAAVNTYVATTRNTVGSGNVFANLWRFTTAPDDNTSTFLYADDGDGSANRLRIDSDGDVKNHDNSYGAISDERIKQDITDANSQWDDIKAVKVRNFKKKDDVRQYGDKAWSQIGVIAQELETVSPKLIRENSVSVGDILSSDEFGTLEDDLDNPKSYYEDGDTIPNGKKVGDAKEYHKKVKEQKTTVKSVNYSILYMKAVKALQEAMTRIETLESKVKTLEDA